MTASLNNYEYEQYESPSDMSRAVMRRIWMVFFVRRTLTSESFKVVVFMTCCVTAVFMVSIPHIIENLSRLPGVVEGASYLLGAFLNTSFVVEGTVVLALGAASWLVWDIGRNVSSAGYSYLMRSRSRA